MTTRKGVTVMYIRALEAKRDAIGTGGLDPVTAHLFPSAGIAVGK